MREVSIRLSRNQHVSVTLDVVVVGGGSLNKIAMSSKFAKYVRTRFGRRKKHREPQVGNRLVHCIPSLNAMDIIIWFKCV